MAADALTIFDHLEATLKGTPGLVGQRVYMGLVPGDASVGTVVPPYIFLQPSPGTPFPERPASGEPDLRGLVARFYTTVAASDHRAVLGVAGRLQRLLAGMRVGSGGVIMPVEMQQEAAVLAMDTTVSPARPYIALAWTLQSNTNPTT